MSITKTLFGVSRIIPETDETGWGTQVTNWLVDVSTALDALITLVSNIPFPVIPKTDTSLAQAATLTPSQTCHRVSGTPGAVTLSTTTPIAAGSKEGQYLLLIGTNNTNTVTIEDSGTVDQNGDITLGLGQAIAYRWSASRALWEELTRNA